MNFRANVRFGNNNPLGLVIGIILLIAIVYGLIKLTQWIFSLLYYVAPLLLIATLIIDVNVVKNFIGNLRDLARRNPPLGIAAIALSLVFFPIPIAWLFYKAVTKRQVKKYQETQRRIEEGDLVDFEELESRPLEKRKVTPDDEDIV